MDSTLVPGNWQGSITLGAPPRSLVARFRGLLARSEAAQINTKLRLLKKLAFSNKMDDEEVLDSWEDAADTGVGNVIVIFEEGNVLLS